jgi:hypothetical protein
MSAIHMGVFPSEARPYLMLHVPLRSTPPSKFHESLVTGAFPSSFKSVHPVIKPPTEGSKAAAQAAVEVILINSRLFKTQFFQKSKNSKKHG